MIIMTTIFYFIISTKAYYNNSIPNFLYQASIRFEGVHFCSGSIISNNSILTSAYCCQNNQINYPVSYLSVVVGNVDILNATSNTLERNVSHILIHKDYRRNNLLNNIAIIKINGDFGAWNDHIQPIKTAKSNFPIGTNCTATGWSSAEAKLPIDGLLKDERISLIKNDNTSLPLALSGIYIYANKTCVVDYGSPLVCRSELVGIFSYGSCDDILSLGWYTNVTNYAKWIEENMYTSKCLPHRAQYFLVLFLFVFVLLFK